MSEPKKVLFLDDRSKRLHAALEKYAPPEYDLTLVCTAKECIKKLSNEGPWDIVSLDHDLGFEEFVDSSRSDCGMEVVRYVEKNSKVLLRWGWPNKIIIHTSNNFAGEIMRNRLRNVLEKLGGGILKFTIICERFDYGEEI